MEIRKEDLRDLSGLPEDVARDIDEKLNKELPNCENIKDFNKLRGEIVSKYGVDVASKENRIKNSEKITDEESLKILKNPKLMDVLIKETDKKVVREEDTRKTIIAFKCGELVENAQPTSYNLLLAEDSGVGKDYLLKKTLEIFPKENRLHKAKITPQVLAYWHNGYKEPDWNWNGKSLYLEEISYNTLNSDTITAFLSNSNFNSTVLVNQAIKELKVNGKPVIFVTTASKNPKEDQLRRFSICHLNDSIDQTKEIVRRRCKFKKEGKSIDYEKKVTRALSHLKRVKVKIPYAEELGDALINIVNVHKILRTNIDKYLDIIASITALHQNQRERDKEGYYLATEEDYEIARPILNKITKTISTIPLTKEKKKCLSMIRELEENDDENEFHTNKEILGKITFWSRPTLYKRLQDLADSGFLTQENIEKIDNKDRTYKVLAYKTVNASKFTFPEFEDIKKLAEDVKSVKTTKSFKSIKTVKSKE